MKVAFVIHRFGKGIAGGAESLAYMFAKQKSKNWDITILTTTARSYHTWANELPEGLEEHKDFEILRFKTSKQRDIKKFSKSSWDLETSNYRLSPEEETQYFEDQGPYSPELKKFVIENQSKFERFVFFTYLYYTTNQIILEVADKSFLFPTAHDEPPFYMSRTLRPIFKNIKGIYYLSDSELKLIDDIYKPSKTVIREKVSPRINTRIVLTPEEISKYEEQFAHILNHAYFLFLGRANAAKNVPDLIHAFCRLKHDRGDQCYLVFCGSMELEWQHNEHIHNLGFVNEREKTFLLERARALVNPSVQESLSIVLLEAWQAATPVIVNGGCSVTKSLCENSRGGLYYNSEAMLQTSLHWFLSNHKQAAQLGNQGRSWLAENFADSI